MTQMPPFILLLLTSGTIHFTYLGVLLWCLILRDWYYHCHYYIRYSTIPSPTMIHFLLEMVMFACVIFSMRYTFFSEACWWYYSVRVMTLCDWNVPNTICCDFSIDTFMTDTIVDDCSEGKWGRAWKYQYFGIIERGSTVVCVKATTSTNVFYGNFIYAVFYYSDTSDDSNEELHSRWLQWEADCGHCLVFWLEAVLFHDDVFCYWYGTMEVFRGNDDDTIDDAFIYFCSVIYNTNVPCGLIFIRYCYSDWRCVQCDVCVITIGTLFIVIVDDVDDESGEQYAFWCVLFCYAVHATGNDDGEWWSVTLMILILLFMILWKHCDTVCYDGIQYSFDDDYGLPFIHYSIPFCITVLIRLFWPIDCYLMEDAIRLPLEMHSFCYHSIRRYSLFDISLSGNCLMMKWWYTNCSVEGYIICGHYILRLLLIPMEIHIRYIHGIRWHSDCSVVVTVTMIFYIMEVFIAIRWLLPVIDGDFHCDDYIITMTDFICWKSDDDDVCCSYSCCVFL